ncbi:MAG: C25 family cysteine peptidase, partial [Paludibacter sp.]|nr:C25 family cysteine peptidase [Paludibacter sp.]
MKKISIFLFLMIIFGAVSAQNYQTTFSQKSEREYNVSFSMTDWSLGTFQTNNATFQTIEFSASATTNKQGWAQLPVVSVNIQLPADKNVDLAIEYVDYQDVNLDYPLLPSRGTIYRNQDPSQIPYKIAPASLVNEFYPSSISEIGEPFIIRDVRGINVQFYPFQYNAVTNILRIYKKINIKLVENNQSPINPLINPSSQHLREVEPMYKSIFLNYSPSRVALAAGQYGNILVITTPRDEATIQPYIQWKKEKGYKVEEEVVSTGTNVKTLIQQKYNENNALLYVQLVGDWADIKSDMIYVEENAPVDVKLGCVVGTDNYPDISVGRFSCSNAVELQTQINKAINYEKNPNMDTNWRETFIGIGSSLGPGDDNETDKSHIQRIFTERLDPFTYNTHQQNYDPGANATTLAGHINLGASTIAYCGHGDVTQFVTSNFYNSNVNNLTNGDKLPFIVSVACLNGAFHHSGDCFAEAWLKKQNGGAVATLMSTILQPWDQPMRIQDYFYDILVGGFNYNNYSDQSGINTNEQRTFFGAIAINAFNLGLSEDPSTDCVQTVQTWTTFGDASLQVRTKQPDIIESSNNMIMSNIPYETTITANGNPVPNAMVSISQNDLYYSAITDENGHVEIPNDLEPGDVLLVVTAFNTTTIYQTISCIPMNNPYIIASNDNTTPLTYISSNSTVAVTLKNIGANATAGMLNVTISCDDPQLTINNGTAQSEVIDAGESAVVNFTVSVDNNIDNNKVFSVKVTSTDIDD